MDRANIALLTPLSLGRMLDDAESADLTVRSGGTSRWASGSLGAYPALTRRGTFNLQPVS